MNRHTFRHLQALARSTTFERFVEDVIKWPRRYGVPLWSMADYLKLYKEATVRPLQFVYKNVTRIPLTNSIKSGTLNQKQIK